MASETKIGQLVIDLKIKTEALEKGLETAKQKIQEIEQSNNQLKNSNSQIDASYLAMSATAVVALGKIVGAIKDCVNEYNSYTQAMSSLENVSQYTGESMSEFSNIMNKFGAYMTKADLATTIKNFSLMGMSAQQTEQMLEALTNSAIRNRNANYTVSEAVRVASEGYRQGLSTLSDSAGVTENLSVMLDNYAKSIGKTASQLTEAEKNQAYLNRTMYAAEPFAGAMSGYMETLAGKQGQYSQAMRETQVAYAEALEPTLKNLTEMGTGILTFLNEAIEKNPSLVAGTTAFTVTLAGATIAIIALTAAKKAYTTATGLATVSTKAFTKALLANPITWWIVGISTVVGLITTTVSKFNDLKNSLDGVKEKFNETSDAQERYNKMIKGTLEATDENIKKIKKDRDMTQHLLELEKDRLETFKDFDKISQKTNKEDTNKANELKTGSYKRLNKELVQYNKYLIKNLENETKKKRQTLIDIGQTRADIEGKQKLLDILKQGKTSTEQFKDAKSQLIKVYPELERVNENTIQSVQHSLDEERKASEEKWNMAQKNINKSYAEVSALRSNKDLCRQIAAEMKMDLKDLNALLDGYINGLFKLSTMNVKDLALGIVDTSNFTPKVKKSSSGGSKSSKSYENKKLDNYKKLIEYKKSLDKISLEDEIKMYKKALNEYAKTTDEKRELRTKIYELEKELQEKSLDDYTSKIEHKKALDKVSLEKEIKMYEKAYKNLAKTTEQKEELEEKLFELRKELAEKNKELMQEELEAYEENIEKQKKIRGSAYTTIQEESDIDKLIEKHNKYLDKVFKDEKLSKQKKKEIQKEELESIKELEEKKKDIRVENTNNMLSLLKDAITKQLEDEEKAQKEAIENNIKVVEEWKDARIKAINEEYDARIKTIEKELDLLNKSEEEKTRAEEDAEYERKKKRLEELVAFEHDIVTKANYQKELDKLIAEHKKTLDKRELQDKKDALNEQKELLKEEQSNEVKYIEDQAEKQKEQYEKEIDELEKFYDKKKDLAEETAKQMILNADKSQKQIINLLKSYNGTYETLGQNFGEKLVYGMSNKIADNIQNVVSKIQNTIDSNINSKIKSWTSSIDKAQSSTKQAQVQNKTITVNQTNQIVQNPEMPSETYRKLKDIDRALADRLAGVW